MRSKLGKWLIELGYRLLTPDERAHWDAICNLGMKALKALEALRQQQTKSHGIRVPTVETEQPLRFTIH